MSLLIFSPRGDIRIAMPRAFSSPCFDRFQEGERRSMRQKGEGIKAAKITLGIFEHFMANQNEPYFVV
jgi:hypothetical protein